MTFVLQASLLAGTIIGAGVFALPFAFAQSGMWVGVAALVIALAASIVVYLLYAEIIVRTEGEHRFVGYAQRYLGAGAAWVAIVMTIVEMIFVMTIYLILSVSFLDLIIVTGGFLEKMLAFWFAGSLGVFLTLRRIAWIEFIVTGAIIAIIGAIFALALPHIDRSLLQDGDFSRILIPLAPLLFALSGRVAIPSLIAYSRKRIGRAIAVGVCVPAAVYILFILGVRALSPATTPDAVTGLIGALSPAMLAVVGALGILALLSSYITVGLDVRRSLALDLRMPVWLRFLLLVGGPLGIYFIGFTSFIGLVSFVGGVFLALEAFFIIAMWRSAVRRAPEKAPAFRVPKSAIAGTALVFAVVLGYEVARVLLY